MQTCYVNLKRIMMIMLVILLLCPGKTAFADGSRDVSRDVSTQVDTEAWTITEVPDGMKLCAKNDDLTLYFSEDSAAIAVENRADGHVWTSAMDAGSMPPDATRIQREESSSLIELTYTSVTSFSSKTRTASLENMKYEVKTKEMPGGISYEIYIPKLDCTVVAEFVLDEYGLRASVPRQGIREAVKSGESIMESRDEAIRIIDEQIDSLENIRGSDGLSSDDKSQVELSLRLLGDMKAELGDITTAYGISDRIAGLEDTIEELNKKGYRGLSLMPLRIRLAQMEKTEAAAIVSLRILPYFGAATDSDDGYVLYPDGSGALYRFDKNHGVYKNCFASTTYSQMETDLVREKELDSMGLTNLMIPYYGIKLGDDGFIAYVSSGRAMSDIRFCPSGYILPVSRASAGFTYRNVVAMSSAAGEWKSGSDTMVFEKTPADYEAAVEIRFLAGEEASYSGMANSLREYLLGEGILSKSDLLGDRLPMGIEFLGAYNDKLLIMNRYRSGTDFMQAGEVAGALEGIPLLCSYKGAFAGGLGVDPQESKLCGILGSADDLKGLVDKVNAGGGRLFLENDQLTAGRGQDGYSESDLTIDHQFVIYSTGEYDTKYLISPNSVAKREERLIEDYISFGNVGLADTLMGSFIYPDHNKKAPVSRLETAELWHKDLQNAKDRLGAVSVKAGNDYTFAAADWIQSIPCGSGGYSYCDEDVPFYEMLTHGYLAETSTFCNEFADKQEQLLRSIEYGMLPCFSLTVDPADWDVEGAYASRFSDIYPEMIEIYNKCLETEGRTFNVPMVKHSRENGVAEVTYENGDKIIINYTDHEVRAGEITVGPMDLRCICGKEDDQSAYEKVEVRKISTEAQGTAERVTVYAPLAVWICAVLCLSIVLFCAFSIFKNHRHEDIQP